MIPVNKALAVVIVLALLLSLMMWLIMGLIFGPAAILGGLVFFGIAGLMVFRLWTCPEPGTWENKVKADEK